MQLNVLYFAHVRAVTGISSEELVVPVGATVGAVADLLVARYPDLGPLRDVVRYAVNGEFADPATVVPANAEFVMIPPVAGGSGSLPVIGLVDEPLEPVHLERLTAYVSSDAYGAVATFTGVVRNHARGRSVSELHYEAYASMAQTKLEEVAREVESRVSSVRVAVLHRVGTLAVGDTAVICAAGSAHRAEAFEACRMLIDRLKEEVPIWKREVGPDGEEWVSDRP